MKKKVIEPRLLTLTYTLTLPHEVIVSDGDSSDRTVEPVPQELWKPAIRLVPQPGGALRKIQRIGFHSLVNVRSRTAMKTRLTSHVASNCGYPT